jgi:hypothetical protein
MKKLIVIGIFFLIFISPTKEAFSQPNQSRDFNEPGPILLNTNEGEDNPDPPPPPPPIPIDGGIIWLLLAGAGYGVKKIMDHKKKQ